MPKKTIEVDEEQLLQDVRLRNVLAKAMAHPEAKVLLQRAHKLVDANAITPDLDDKGNAKDPLQPALDRVAALEAKLTTDAAEREKKERLDALQASIAAGLRTLRQEGWTEDGIKAVEKIMEEKGLIDPSIAAAYYEKQHPPQELMTPGSTGAWNFMELQNDTSEDLKKLIETKGESTPLLDKMAYDALKEVRGEVQRRR